MIKIKATNIWFSQFSLFFIALFCFLSSWPWYILSLIIIEMNRTTLIRIFNEFYYEGINVKGLHIESEGNIFHSFRHQVWIRKILYSLFLLEINLLKIDVRLHRSPNRGSSHMISHLLLFIFTRSSEWTSIRESWTFSSIFLKGTHHRL